MIRNGTGRYASTGSYARSTGRYARTTGKHGPAGNRRYSSHKRVGGTGVVIAGVVVSLLALIAIGLFLNRSNPNAKFEGSSANTPTAPLLQSHAAPTPIAAQGTKARAQKDDSTSSRPTLGGPDRNQTSQSPSDDNKEEQEYQAAVRQASETESYWAKAQVLMTFHQNFPTGRHALEAQTSYRKYGRMALLVDTWAKASQDLGQAQYMPIGVQQHSIVELKTVAQARAALDNATSLAEQAYINARLGTLAYEDSGFDAALAYYDKAEELYGRLHHEYFNRLSQGEMECCLYNSFLIQICEMRCRACRAFSRSECDACDPELIASELKLVSGIVEGIKAADHGQNWANWTGSLVRAGTELERGFSTLLGK